MTARRARIYDAVALCTVVLVIVLDQWTKSLVVTHMGAPGSGNTIPLVGHYLVLDYIQNSGAAFGVFANQAVLVVLIAAAVCVVAYLYIRILNTGPLIYKVIFGMIIGGALGNLIDRAHNGGVVTDFISFRIPEINYYFAVFNIADACISVGVVLLFILVLFSGFKRDKHEEEKATTSTTSGSLRTSEQDVKH